VAFIITGPFWGELGLDLVYFLGGDLECLGEHAVGQLTGSLEEHHGDGLCAGKLAVEDRDDNSGSGTLKLHEAPWESKSVDFGYELIGDDDKADTERALEDKDELGGAWVHAWRV